MIHPTAIIYPNVTIEEDVEIGAYCIIGAPAEDKKNLGNQGKGVIIKRGTKITGHVTIDAGTVRATTIEEDCFIMKGVHIGHDATIWKGATLSPHVVIGGHASIGAGTNMGMGSIIHQHCSVPNGCMIGANSFVGKSSELWQGGVYVGNPVKFLRYNDKK